MHSTVDTPVSGLQRCVSCDAPLTGPYCSQCGEHVVEPETLTLRHFVGHTVVHELFHLDSALWRTLRLLFTRPGALALQFAAGRRRPYVNPFRLLLISIVAYALMSSSGFIVTWRLGPVTTNIAPAKVRRSVPVEDTVAQIDRFGLLRRQFAAKAQRLTGEEAREHFHDRLEAFAEPVSFANVLLLAAALHLCFRGKRRFLEDTAFSMHFASFVMLSSVTLVVAVSARFWLHGYLLLVIALVGLWHFVYLTFAIRRFYLPTRGWTGWPVSVLASVVLYLLNSAFMTGVQVVGAAIALALS
jgi:hypothetical protein